MAIDSRLIVQVFPSILQPGASDLELNGLLLSKNTSIPISQQTHNMLQFMTPADVLNYFGPDSDEYKFATVYFRGYMNSWRMPNRLIVARYNDTSAPAWIRGDPLQATLADFKLLTAANFQVSFSGTVVTITPINLSQANSYSQVASILQAAIRTAGESTEEGTGATVEYNSNFRGFVLTAGGAGGDGQTITDVSGDLAELMMLADDTNPTVSDGADANSQATIMENIRQTIGDWATFTTTWEASTSEMVSFAQWQALYPVNYLYCPWDNDANGNLRTPGNTDNNAVILSDLDADVAFQLGAPSGSGLTGAGYEWAAFVMGVAASINFNAFQGTITFAHKQQSGLEYNVNNTTEAQALIDKGVNFYGNFATRNDTFHRFYPGRTLGEWRWIDHFVNGIWFFNALNNAAMYGLGLVPRIPYTPGGLGIIRSFYMDPIIRALRNGVIDAGGTLSEAQKAEVIRQAGFDITPDLQMYGYYLQVAMPDPAARLDRDTTDNVLWYMYMGSVHRLELRAVSIA